MKAATHQILFFADRLPPLIGGVEMHAGYFIEHFRSHTHFPLAAVVTKDREGHDSLQDKENHKIGLAALPEMFQPRFLFFNSGRWIEELPLLRHLFPQTVFLYRTGGNEIVKAPLASIPDHTERQKFWAATLNRTIDCLITNSAYTEKRLQELGVACPFLRCIGGVNAESLKPAAFPPDIPTLFSAARFVPYKNHALLLDVIGELKRRRRRFRLRLAGDGPLFKKIQEEAVRQDLLSVVDFLGPLDNHSVCKEIAKASIYVQFSSDYLTSVPGGSYIHSEGMGRSILEAITAGTYVIAGNSGALSEIVTPQRGMLVCLDDRNHLVNILDHLLLHPPERSEHIAIYDWSKLFQRYEAFMESCI